MTRAERVATSVNRLVVTYASALQVVDTLPRLGWTPVILDPVRPVSWYEVFSWRQPRRFVSRPAVRLYVETHVRAQLHRAIAALDRELFRVGLDDETRQLREVRAQLSDLESGLASWGRVRSVLFRLPFVSVPAGLLAAWLFAAGESRPSGVDAVGATVLLASVPIYIYYAVVPSLMFGFLPKRAVLSGGVTDASHGLAISDLKLRQETTLHWTAMEGPDRPNVYEIEDEVLADLGWTKRNERSLDVVLSPIYPLMVLYLVLAVVVSAIWARGWWIAVGVAVVAVLVGLFIALGVSHRRLLQQRAKRRTT